MFPFNFENINQWKIPGKDGFEICHSPVLRLLIVDRILFSRSLHGKVRSHVFIHGVCYIYGPITYCLLPLTGTHLGGGRIHTLPSKRKVSLSRPFAPKIPNKGLK